MPVPGRSAAVTRSTRATSPVPPSPSQSLQRPRPPPGPPSRPAGKGCGCPGLRKWERLGRTPTIVLLLQPHLPGPAKFPRRRRPRSSRPVQSRHAAAAAAALRGPGLRGAGRGPARLHHAAVDAGVQGHLRLLGQRHAGRAAQPPPGGPQRHPGAAAGAPGRLGAAAGRGGQLPDLLQRAGVVLQQGEAHQLHAEPVLPPGLLPLPQRHSPQLLRGLPQRDGLPHLPRPHRHLGAPLARQGRGGLLRPAGADEVPADHPRPAAFPQHHLRGHPAGSEHRDRKAEQPVARPAGAGSDPGGLGGGGHGRRHLLVHRWQLLAEATAVPRHPTEAGDRPSVTPQRQGTDPARCKPLAGGSRGWDVPSLPRGQSPCCVPRLNATPRLAGMEKTGKGSGEKSEKKAKKALKGWLSNHHCPHSGGGGERGRKGGTPGRGPAGGHPPPRTTALLRFWCNKPLLPTASCCLPLLWGWTVRPELARPRGRLAGLAPPELVVTPRRFVFAAAGIFPQGQPVQFVFISLISLWHTKGDWR